MNPIPYLKLMKQWSGVHGLKARSPSPCQNMFHVQVCIVDLTFICALWIHGGVSLHVRAAWFACRDPKLFFGPRPPLTNGGWSWVRGEHLDLWLTLTYGYCFWVFVFQRRLVFVMYSWPVSSLKHGHGSWGAKALWKRIFQLMRSYFARQESLPSTPCSKSLAV